MGRLAFTVLLFFTVCTFWNDNAMSTYIKQRRGFLDPFNNGGCPKPFGAGICVMGCSSDADCGEREKCCSNGCGWVCKEVASYKPGSCPNLYEQHCQSMCTTDGDCSGPNKCCFIGCGSVCLDPVPEK